MWSRNIFNVTLLCCSLCCSIMIYHWVFRVIIAAVSLHILICIENTPWVEVEGNIFRRWRGSYVTMKLWWLLTPHSSLVHSRFNQKLKCWLMSVKSGADLVKFKNMKSYFLQSEMNVIKKICAVSSKVLESVKSAVQNFRKTLHLLLSCF